MEEKDMNLEETEVKEENELETLKKQLLAEKKDIFAEMTTEKIEAAYDYAKGYMQFLDKGKTERECVYEAEKMLAAEGFKPYTFGMKVAAGEKYYYNNRAKSFVAFVVGSESIENGVYFSAAHIDSPRIDLKQHPLYGRLFLSRSTARSRRKTAKRLTLS